MRPQTNTKTMCKNGQKCKFLANGNCYYYHPSQHQNTQHIQSNHNINPNQFHQNNQQRNKSRGKKMNYYQKSTQGFNNSSNFNTQVNPLFRDKMQQSNQSLLCKFFHYGNICKYGEKCTKKHQFLFNSNKKLQRLIYQKITPNKISRIGKIKGNGDDSISIRLDNNVFKLKYQFFNNKLADAQILFQVPNIQGKNEYYAQRGNYIYFSFENAPAQFNRLSTNIGFHNITNKQTIWIQNGHNAKLTGLLHYDQQTLYSCSMGGEIKVWVANYQGNYMQDQAMTKYITSCYNPKSKLMEILFLHLQIVDGGFTVMSAGTNDGRLLLWTDNNTKFMEINVGYDKVYKAKITKIGDIIASIILAWNTTNNSSIIQVHNLQSGESMTILEANGYNGNLKANIHTFQFIDDYIFIGNMKGDVIIHDVKQGKQIGAIYHQNMISDIICQKAYIEETALSLTIIYILEKQVQAKEGSFSIYLLL